MTPAALSGGGLFETEIATANGVVVLHVAGELDIAVAADLRRALSNASSAGGKELVVDVSNVTFMDARNLGLLVSVDRRLVGDGRRPLVVHGASGIVRRVFELTNTASLLDDRNVRVEASDVVVDQSRAGAEFDSTRREANVSLQDLFVSYFALGGTADLPTMQAFADGNTTVLDTHQREIARYAISERLVNVRGRAA